MKTRSGSIKMDTLSDDSLLQIFDFCRQILKTPLGPYWDWYTLVHVCRRWRQLIFASPRRLDLKLLCGPRTPVRRILDCWPPLPLAINNDLISSEGDEDNLVAALEHPDRICRISSCVRWQLSDKIAKIQQPFPALTYLYLSGYRDDRIMRVLPDGFLGGYSPRLLDLRLDGILFPALPKFLSSTSNLVRLHLIGIPISGCISPEVMANCLSMLPKLKWLSIMFKSLIPFPDQSRQCPPPLQRAVLPTLTTFSFKGNSEYLEDLVSRIDAPLLISLHLGFFDQPSLTFHNFPFHQSHRKFRIAYSSRLEFDLNLTS
ncbi:hypothetical protein B0F90DRAFT_1929002, partial [Multifurca ochricompacta]